MEHDHSLYLNCGFNCKTICFALDVRCYLLFCLSEMTAVENMNFTTPDVATSWIIDGFSLSSSHGLSLLESPTQLRAVKSFFVQMDLPHSVIKGEEVQIPVIVHNHMSTCVVVKRKYFVTYPNSVTIMLILFI